MPSRYVQFLGAPETTCIDWDDERSLFDQFDPRLTAEFQFQPEAFLGDEEKEVQWRVLPLVHQHLKSGLTQSFETPVRDGVNHPIDGRDTSFFTTTSLSFVRDNSEAELGSEGPSSAESAGILSQFYDHSLAVHEELPSSLISLSQSTAVTDSFVEDPVVDEGSGKAAVAYREGGGQVNHKSSKFSLDNVITIPNASRLIFLEPQTVTVNLIVGIISLLQKAVYPQGVRKEILEMIVGDETKSGFGITFWLPPNKDSHGLQGRENKKRKTLEKDSHGHPGGENDKRKKLEKLRRKKRKMLEKLRPQDIVLLRNVELAPFMGQVYGKSTERATTGFQLLYRKKVDRHDEGGVYSSKDLASAEEQDVILKKVKTAREWVLNFVGVTSLLKDAARPRNSKDNERGKRRRSPLPPDTQ